MKAQFKSVGLMFSVTLSIVFFSAYADTDEGKCREDYRAMIETSKFRAIIEHITVKKPSDLALLNDMQKKAFTLYAEDFKSAFNGKRVFSVQLAQYIDRKTPTQINGYRVKMNVNNGEKPRVFYYFNQDAQLLLSAEMSDEPAVPMTRTWHCENLGALVEPLPSLDE